MVVTLAPANLAQHVHIRQEVHFDATLALTLASLAAPATDVEGETPGLVSAFPRFRQHGVQIANLSEYSGVSCRIGTRRASNGRLINANHLVHALQPSDALVPSRLFTRSIKRLGQRAIKDVVHQRGLA